jgi:hypothetical protein
MKWMMAAIALTIMMMSHISRAEEKFFITDVLEKKEVEGGVNFSYAHLSYDVSSQVSRASVNRRLDQTFANFSFNVGLGHGFEVGASIPYVFSRRSKTDYYALPYRATSASEEGFGDVLLRSKYLILDERENPFTLVAGLGVKFETASEDDVGSGTTDIKPLIAASTTVGQSLRPYAIYQLTSRNHGSGDTHAFEFGAEKELSDDMGLNASLEADFHTSSDFFHSRESYHFTIESYIRMGRNFYAIPGVDYGIHSSFEKKEGSGRFESYNGIQLMFQIYYLF